MMNVGNVQYKAQDKKIGDVLALATATNLWFVNRLDAELNMTSDTLFKYELSVEIVSFDRKKMNSRFSYHDMSTQ